MKACVLEGINNLVYKEVPTPEIQNDEVLLQIKACGVCSSDIDRVLKTGTYHFPTIPGHEFAGQIIKIGSNVDSKLLGRRAVVYPLIPCRRCSYCREEEYALCDNYNYFGSRCDGAFAEYIAVPEWNILPFSDSLQFEEAALCEPASVALHAVTRGNIKKGETVAIIGTGTIGILAGMWAKIQGADNVIIIGRSKDKLAFVQKLGFTYVFNSKTTTTDMMLKQLAIHNTNIDTVLECVGSVESLTTAINIVKKHGKIVAVGNPTKDMTLDRNTYWKILRSELSLIGTWNSNYGGNKDDWKKVIGAMETGNLNIKPLITHKLLLERTNEAFTILTNQDIFSIKVMITND